MCRSFDVKVTIFCPLGRYGTAQLATAWLCGAVATGQMQATTCRQLQLVTCLPDERESTLIITTIMLAF